MPILRMMILSRCVRRHSIVREWDRLPILTSIRKTEWRGVRLIWGEKLVCARLGEGVAEGSMMGVWPGRMRRRSCAG